MLFLVIIILSYLLQMVLPWWACIIVAFGACAIIGKTGKIALWSSFFAIFLLWTGMALFKSLPNEHILANRVAQAFFMQSWWQITLATGLVSGLVASISGLCGYHFRKSILALRSK